MTKYFILEENDNIRKSTLVEWVQWFAIANRQIADTTIEDFRISTVFLGIDHNFSKIGEPILFETMVFGLMGNTTRCYRYSTKNDAIQGHTHCVTEILNLTKLSNQKMAATITSANFK